MAVVGFGLLSHVPTIMLPEEVRRELNEGKEISLVPGLRRLRNEVFDELEPETFVILDTHWASTVEHLLTAQARRSGRYTSDELPRGMHGVPYDYPGDPELAHAAEAAAHRLGQPAHASEDPYLPVHYPTINLLHYLWRGERVVSVSCCQTGTTPDFLSMGRAIGEAVEETGRRTVLLASGGMSHRFWPLPELPLHEASDPIHVRTPEARAADEERLGWLQAGGSPPRHRDHGRLRPLRSGGPLRPLPDGRRRRRWGGLYSAGPAVLGVRKRGGYRPGPRLVRLFGGALEPGAPDTRDRSADR